MVTCLRLILVNNYFLRLALFYHGSGNACPVNDRSTDLKLCVIADNKNLIEGYALAGVYTELLNSDDIALGNFVLFTPGCYNRIPLMAPPLINTRQLRRQDALLASLCGTPI